MKRAALQLCLYIQRALLKKRLAKIQKQIAHIRRRNGLQP